jgi:hypothetical protein
VELEAHDRGNASGFSNQGLLHDIPDDEFSFRALFQVEIWPELGCGGHGYMQGQKDYSK